MPPDLARSLTRARRLVGLIASSALVALACFVLGAWAWTRPLRASSTSVAPYENVFTLGYRGEPKPNTAYGSGPVVTGEPLFLAALDTLQFSVRYDFHAPQPASVAGTLTAQALVADNGLVVPLGKATTVGVRSGAPSTVTLPISFVRYRDALASLGRLSGVGTYPVEVEATVDLHGRLGSRAFATTSATDFTFQGDAGALAPPSSGSQTPTEPIAETAAVPSFHHVLRGDVRWPSTSLRRWDLGLLTATPRSFALALGGLGVAGAALAILWRRRLARLLRSDERVPTLLRAGTRVVEVEKPPTLGPDRQVTELRHITDLLRVARALETPLLVVKAEDDLRLEARDGREVYVLSLGGRRPASSSGETIGASTEGCVVADGEPRRSSERSWQCEPPPAVNGRRA